MAGKPRAIKHGTPGGYMAHRRRDEAPCGSCTTAWRMYYQERRGDLPRRVYLRQKAEAKAKRQIYLAMREREYAARREAKAARRLSKEMEEQREQARVEDPTE